MVWPRRGFFNIVNEGSGGGSTRKGKVMSTTRTLLFALVTLCLSTMIALIGMVGCGDETTVPQPEETVWNAITSDLPREMSPQVAPTEYEQLAAGNHRTAKPSAGQFRLPSRLQLDRLRRLAGACIFPGEKHDESGHDQAEGAHAQQR